MKKWIICCAIAAAVCSVWAQNRRAESFYVGHGVNTSCGKWLEKRKEHARTGDILKMAGELAWLQGFLSGVNVARRDEVNLPDWQTLAAMVDNECSQHPQLVLMEAASAVYFKIKEGQK